jgi:CPA1 family monovalent cation:H+ antiporter
MSAFDLFALLLLAAAAAGFVNYRFLRLPSAIGLLVIALLASLAVTGVAHVLGGAGPKSWITQALLTADFPHVLFDGALSFMLFAGALHVNLERMREHAWTILVLATVGVILATALYGGAMWLLFGALGIPVPLIWCLVLGSILAPTDPIAVTGLLREMGLPAGLLAVITGESLFNDGVAVVAFTTLLRIATGDGGHQAMGIPLILLDFLRDAGGGVLLGLASGYAAFQALRRVDEYNLELTISLALVTVTYALALRIGVSGPIAVVVAGVLTGSHATRHAMSETTRTNVILFWSLIDELLNALLFLLVGLETLTIDLSHLWPLAMLGGVILAVLTRFVSASVPATVLNMRRPHKLRALAVLTWGGLRGGISAALALTLPNGATHELLLQVCYAVVVFTIVVQGLTMPALVRRLYWTQPQESQD